jgi:hypothetical protein
MRNFIIGTGYYAKRGESWGPWFAKIWADNLKRYDHPSMDRVICIGNGGCCNPYKGEDIDFIGLDGNLGHIHQLIGKAKPYKDHQFCGWSGAILAGALLAYANETDAVFLEQDCLAFGPWIERLYSELGDAQMIFGKSKHMPCAQSLFLIKHNFIPDFVKYYMAGSDRAFIPETKFKMLIDQGKNVDVVRQFSFGCDRDRPIPMNDDVFYVQKLTPGELQGLHAMGLIGLPPGMPDVKVFSNDGINL